MNLQVFRVPNQASAGVVAHGLRARGMVTRAGVRHHQTYVAVRTDRGDVEELVKALAPTAVPVNLEHLPAPLPDDESFVP